MPLFCKMQQPRVFNKINTVELQWLEHGWFVYHGCFELVLESLGNTPIAAELGYLGYFFLFMVYCVYTLESLRSGDSNENTQYTYMLKNRKYISIMHPDLALRLTLTGSNYPCLELIFMVPKVFEPLKFYCMLGGFTNIFTSE